jgi:hypothetical protein
MHRQRRRFDTAAHCARDAPRARASPARRAGRTSRGSRESVPLESFFDVFKLLSECVSPRNNRVTIVIVTALGADLPLWDETFSGDRRVLYGHVTCRAGRRANGFRVQGLGLGRVPSHRGIPPESNHPFRAWQSRHRHFHFSPRPSPRCSPAQMTWWRRCPWWTRWVRF